jgi:hypothetical protein
MNKGIRGEITPFKLLSSDTPSLDVPRGRREVHPYLHQLAVGVSAKRLERRFIVDGLQQGLIIFIHQNDHGLARLLVGTPDDALESQANRYISAVLST